MGATMKLWRVVQLGKFVGYVSAVNEKWAYLTAEKKYGSHICVNLFIK